MRDLVLAGVIGERDSQLAPGAPEVPHHAAGGHIEHSRRLNSAESSQDPKQQDSTLTGAQTFDRILEL